MASINGYFPFLWTREYMHMYRMSECGENLLVDVSEILFNELAFFRLMQNLDTTNAKVKEQLRTFAKVTHFFML